MRSFIKALVLTSFLSIIHSFSGGTFGNDAQAAIRCNGPYQVIRGQGQILTPYCEDAYIARVARGYGVKVSANTVRHNPNRKEEICRFIGHDPRIQEFCSQYTGGDSGDR